MNPTLLVGFQFEYNSHCINYELYRKVWVVLCRCCARWRRRSGPWTCRTGHRSSAPSCPARSETCPTTRTVWSATTASSSSTETSCPAGTASSASRSSSRTWESRLISYITSDLTTIEHCWRSVENRIAVWYITNNLSTVKQLFDTSLVICRQSNSCLTHHWRSVDNLTAIWHVINDLSTVKQTFDRSLAICRQSNSCLTHH